MTPTDTLGPTGAPTVRLIRGNPEPHELAVLLAVLQTVASRTAPVPAPRRRLPKAPWALGFPHPAAGGWRAEPPTHATVRRTHHTPQDS
jgi:hypothetical protein